MAAAALRYQPALDGVRAVALGGVLVVHGMPAWLPGGFLGVDLFFVLSGFLITALLLHEHDTTGRVRLGEFWLRRARRLLPALVVLVATVAAGARWLVPDGTGPALRLDVLAALTYWANWRMIDRGGDYFTATAAASPLEHTWSLGIEEQFYLVWPLLLVLALRTRRPRLVIGVGSLAGVVVSAVAAAGWYQPTDPNRAYFGTDSRAGALLVGCALAAALPVLARRAGRLLPVAALAGTVVIVGAWRFADGARAWLYSGGFTLVAVAGAAGLALLATRPDGVPARLLSAPPLVWLGRISYGAYLWHWPLFAALTAERTGLAGPALFALRVAATRAAATVSHVLVEQPIRRGLAAGRRPVLVPSSAAATAVLVLALVAPSAASPTRPVAAPAANALTPAAPSATAPSAKPDVATVPPVQRAGRRPGPARVSVIGDSVSWTLGEYWPASPLFELMNRGVQGCGIARLPEIRYVGQPHTNYPGCTTWDQRWRTAIGTDDPDVVAILLDRWELMDRRLDGRWTNVGQPDYDRYLAGELRLAIDLATAQGAHVVLLTAPYTRRQERPDGGLWPEDTPVRVDAWNRLIAAVAAEHPAHPVILDLNRVVCPDGRFTWRVGDVRVRSDGLHFTPDGVRRVIAPWLTPQLFRVATS